jgi:hypothetical protein
VRVAFGIHANIVVCHLKVFLPGFSRFAGMASSAKLRIAVLKLCFSFFAA